MKRLLVLGVACSLLTGCDDAPQAETIKIGAVLSMTGDLAGLGAAQSDSISLAVKQINDSGGVLGKQLEVVIADDASDVEKAKAAARTLVDAKVSAVVGAIGSSYTLAAAGVLSANSIVQISASSTSPALTTFEDNGYLFRTSPSDALQGKLLAQRARAKGFTKVAITHVPGAYGEGLAKAFKETFEANQGTVTFLAPYAEKASSYAELLQQIFATSPEAVLLAGYPIDGAQIIKGYNLGYADRRAFWYFADAVASAEFTTTAGGAGAFTFGHEGTVPAAPTGPQFEDFAKAFKAAYGKEPNAGYYDAQTYDAVYLIALAMAAAGKAEGPAIRDQLGAISKGGTQYGAAQFKDAVAAATAGEDVDYRGACGDLDFDDKGDVVGPYDIWQVKDGVMTVVETSKQP